MLNNLAKIGIKKHIYLKLVPEISDGLRQISETFHILSSIILVIINQIYETMKGNEFTCIKVCRTLVIGYLFRFTKMFYAKGIV